ncbi:hypothetical protein [Roseovarius sp. D22-M7]|uniref:hypothetical protein n=1 Tax=Roseovarius sp. D22-M7 TaxID=3127116 RepID=UPI0030102F6C
MRLGILFLVLTLTLASCANMQPTEEPVLQPAPVLEDLQVSRQFLELGNETAEIEGKPIAYLSVIAFPLPPTGALRQRNEMICAAFIEMFKPVATLQSDDIDLDRQVVTVWPVEDQQDGNKLETRVADGEDIQKICAEAVEVYDAEAGDDALADAAAYFESRGKPDIAARIDAPVQDGPWLLGWAPGAGKGNTSDEVLVLAFDLSHVDTRREAERVFQAYNHVVERKPELWRKARISNASWADVIIRFANDIGRDLAFYERMTK